VGLHDLELVRREPPRLEQDAVGNADLADVVEGRRLESRLIVCSEENSQRGWVLSFSASLM
jgi:hypothetical protein